MSNVFIEAQKTANTIVTQAKENARKMDEDAKKLANQVVDDANGKASTIVKNADEKASRILSDAEDKSSEMRAAADKIRKEVEDEIAEIDENVIKLREVLEMFSDESLGRLKAAKEQIDNAQNSIRKGKSSTVKRLRLPLLPRPLLHRSPRHRIPLPPRMLFRSPQSPRLQALI